jgi:hypothetical protein
MVVTDSKAAEVEIERTEDVELGRRCDSPVRLKENKRQRMKGEYPQGSRVFVHMKCLPEYHKS